MSPRVSFKSHYNYSQWKTFRKYTPNNDCISCFIRDVIQSYVDRSGLNMYFLIFLPHMHTIYRSPKIVYLGRFISFIRSHQIKPSRFPILFWRCSFQIESILQYVYRSFYLSQFAFTKYQSKETKKSYKTGSVVQVQY